MRVFVYGTLTDPDRLTTVLERHGERTDCSPSAAFVGRATLDGFHRVDGRYPTLAPGGSVEGRLLAVDEGALAAFDRYEGVDRGLYVRTAVDRTDEGEPVYVYVGNPADLGLEERVRWPGDGSIHSRVEAVAEGARIVPSTRE